MQLNMFEKPRPNVVDAEEEQRLRDRRTAKLREQQERQEYEQRLHMQRRVCIFYDPDSKETVEKLPWWQLHDKYQHALKRMRYAVHFTSPAGTDVENMSMRELMAAYKVARGDESDG